jgi:hypothetical protein
MKYLTGSNEDGSNDSLKATGKTVEERGYLLGGSVLSAIGSERTYQINRWGDRPKSVAEYLTYMRHWLTRAEQEATKGDTDLAALESVRKVTTLGFACMEHNGAPIRMDE